MPRIVLYIFQIQKICLLRQLLPSGTDLSLKYGMILLKLYTQSVS